MSFKHKNIPIDYFNTEPLFLSFRYNGVIVVFAHSFVPYIHTNDKKIYVTAEQQYKKKRCISILC